MQPNGTAPNRAHRPREPRKIPWKQPVTMATLDSTRSSHSIVPTIRDSYDYLTKIILVGASGTGKSCILHRFLKGDYNSLSSQTIGVEFSSKMFDVDDYKIKLQLWDTAGQERFRSLTRSYYRGSAGVILCYDVSRRETLDELHEYLMDIQALTANPCVIIVGNKCDIPLEDQVVDDFDVDQLISRYEGQFGRRIPHIKASAKTAENVNQIFATVATNILRKVELGEIDPDNQNYGVQYGDLMTWNDTLNSSKFNTVRTKPARYIRRKNTTLSLIDRTLEDRSTCWC